MDSKNINEISGEIIGAAIEVHKNIGPGLLESAYEACLCHELMLRKLTFKAQIPIPVIYKQERLECGYRLDLLVEDLVIVELKACGRIEPIHKAQLMTYLKLMDKQLGLIMNFKVPLMRDGIQRVVNNLKE
jgi:GxxExxY protein